MALITPSEGSIGVDPGVDTGIPGKAQIPLFRKNISRSNLPSRSFKDALSGKASSIISTPELTCSSFRGMPAFLISDDSMAKLAAPFEFTLVGKFAFNRPPLDVIRKFFFNLKLSSSFTVSLLDNRHIAIQLTNDLDYSRVFAHRSYYIINCQMKLLKWTPFFDVKEESPIVPVWISFPNLRLHLINHQIIHTIASVFGRPLQTDQATASNSRPSLARVLVELDVSVKHPTEIWIGSELNGYTQKVEFENFPIFCSHCKTHGHELKDCFILNPHLKPVSNMGKQVYKPTEKDSDVHEKSDTYNIANPFLSKTINADIINLSENENITQNIQLNVSKVVQQDRNNEGVVEPSNEKFEKINDKGMECNLNILNTNVDNDFLLNRDCSCTPIEDSFVLAEKLKDSNMINYDPPLPLVNSCCLVNHAKSHPSSQSNVDSNHAKSDIGDVDLEEGEINGNLVLVIQDYFTAIHNSSSSLPPSPTNTVVDDDFTIVNRKKNKKMGDMSIISQRVTRSASANPKF